MNPYAVAAAVGRGLYVEGARGRERTATWLFTYRTYGPRFNYSLCRCVGRVHWEPKADSDIQWRGAHDLHPGDRVEIGPVMCEVLAVHDDGSLDVVQERDGRVRLGVTGSGGSRSLYRYVPDPDPCRRLARTAAVK